MVAHTNMVIICPSIEISLVNPTLVRENFVIEFACFLMQVPCGFDPWWSSSRLPTYLIRLCSCWTKQEGTFTGSLERLCLLFTYLVSTFVFLCPLERPDSLIWIYQESICKEESLEVITRMDDQTLSSWCGLRRHDGPSSPCSGGDVRHRLQAYKHWWVSPLFHLTVRSYGCCVC